MEMETEAPVAAAQPTANPRRRIRVGRRGFYVLVACTLALASLGWWRWQSSWSELETTELETHAAVAEQGLQGSPETVSAETMAKRIVTKVEPAYPEAARKAGTEGLVVLDAVIRPDGSVKSLRRVSGPDLLVQAATEAVQSWKFEPYLTNGQAVDVETTIAVEFRLHGRGRCASFRASVDQPCRRRFRPQQFASRVSPVFFPLCSSVPPVVDPFRLSVKPFYSNFSACWKGTPRLSFAETAGSPSSCQSIFTAGSFHATVRSCSGA